MDTSNRVIGLPLEIWEYNLKFLDEAKDFASARLACRSWRDILNGSAFWRDISTRLFNVGEMQKPYLNSWHEQYKLSVKKEKGCLSVKTYTFPHGKGGTETRGLSLNQAGHILYLQGSISKAPVVGGNLLRSRANRELTQKNLMDSSVQILEQQQPNNPVFFQSTSSYPYVAFMTTRSQIVRDSTRYKVKIFQTETNTTCTLSLKNFLGKTETHRLTHCELDQLYVVTEMGETSHIHSWMINFKENYITLVEHKVVDINFGDAVSGMKSNENYFLFSSNMITIKDKKTEKERYLTDPKDFPLTHLISLAPGGISLLNQKCAAISMSGQLRVWDLEGNEDSPIFDKKSKILADKFATIILQEDFLIVGGYDSTVSLHKEAMCGMVELWNHKTGEKLMEHDLTHSINMLTADEGKIVAGNSNGQMTILDFSANPIPLSSECELISKIRKKNFV